VAATKTYVACLAAVAAIVASVGGDVRLRTGLERLPDTLARVVADGRRWVERSGVVEAFAGSDRAILASRGYDLATVLEMAIKLQETSRLFADAYSTADLEHGPIVLAGADVTTLVVRPDGEMGRRVDGVLERLRATGARPWVIGGQEAPLAEGRDDRDRVVQLPIDVPTELAPAAFIVPGQLLAEAVARARAHDPDRPIGLSKVTRTH
jgi:glucosamine--fructose-6-phosphate aminotransferase (isomerizing)